MMIKRCPGGLSQQTVNEILKNAVSLVCYDPNYIYQDDGDDEKMEEDDGGWGDNSDFSEEQDVQDDDDTSWKVRRGGCRVIQSIILTRPELHGYIIADYTLKLADRFKERSDDVKIELLDAFRLLVQSETHS